MQIPIRIRLILAPALVVLASLVAYAASEVSDARTRVKAETESGLSLSRMVIASALARADESGDPNTAIVQLENELKPVVRHVTIKIEGAGGRTLAEPKIQSTSAPEWFVRLVAAPPSTARFPIRIGGASYGDVALSAAPLDEIEEAWGDWRDEMIVLALVSAAVIAVILVSLSLALRPLAKLSVALDRLEAGDFAVRVSTSSDPQLRNLADRFNRLAVSLEQISADNRLLIDRLMSVQEGERRQIASELHDEIGPTLFAIRADLGAISRLTRKADAGPPEIRERLTSISEMITQIQRINARLLEQLRPVILDQLPLAQALQKLVEGWQGRYPDIAWSVHVDHGRELSDERNQAIYRSAQEALTNVIRHAGARHVDLSLKREPGLVSLSVADDGAGLPEGARLGIGLLGMQERARALGGRLALSKSALGGTLVMLEIPETEAPE